jgi:hypothetical protein
MLTLTSISIPFPSGPSLYTFLVRSFFFFTLTLARTFDTHSQAKKGIGTILLEKVIVYILYTVLCRDNCGECTVVARQRDVTTSQVACHMQTDLYFGPNAPLDAAALQASLFS